MKRITNPSPLLRALCFVIVFALLTPITLGALPSRFTALEATLRQVSRQLIASMWPSSGVVKGPRIVGAIRRSAFASSSILDDVGRLNRKVTSTELAEWSRRNGVATPSLGRSWAKLWLAEFELAGRRNPESALTLFDQALQAHPTSQELQQLAQIGHAKAEFAYGRYAIASSELKALLRSKLSVESRRALALLARHAESCASYHEERKLAGITEPDRIDPLCGASALAFICKAYQLRFDEAYIAKNVPHTGFGSTLKDLADGADKLGLYAVSVTASERGLRELLRQAAAPVVAHVEHDHFIAVLRADDKGVEYACSDCGPWPGGYRFVNWEQWRLMEADAYLAVAKPKSTFATTLSLLPRPGNVVQGLYQRSATSTVSGQFAAAQNAAKSLLQSGVAIFFLPLLIWCGLLPQSAQCCMECGAKQYCPVPSTAQMATQDPVNVATGAEEYKPTPDHVVYNPSGPSVIWGHAYGSMSNPIPNGYGLGWYHPYLYTIKLAVGGTAGGPLGFTPTSLPPLTGGTTGGGGGANGLFGGGGSEGISDGYIIFPNSATLRFNFASATAPTAGDPLYTAELAQPFPYKVEWQYSAGALGGDVIVVTQKDRSKLTFKQWALPSPPTADRCYYISRITDRNGHFIDLNWTGPVTFRTLNTFFYTNDGFALSNIVNDQGSTLLNLTYNAGSPTVITAASDGTRTVNYTVSPLPNDNVPGMPNSDELMSATPTFGGATRSYTYENNINWEGTEKMPYLKTITAPSPSGVGLSTATINYNAYGYVSNVIDGNGSKVQFIEDPGNQTTIKRLSSTGVLAEQYSMTWDGQMSVTGLKNGAGQTVFTLTYADAETSLRPSSVTDGNGRTWSFNWDQWWNLVSTTTPKLTTSTQTISYANFFMGEVTASQQGTKTSTLFTYYQPSGLLQSVQTPVPGQVGTGVRQTTNYTYDGLGNILSVDTPGNNATTIKTTTFNYTTDGAYSQAAMIGQPLTVTDPLGKVYHFRYDSRANVTSAWDPLGNTSTFQYNLANQLTDSFAPATGQTGAGQTHSQTLYRWVGGPSYEQRLYKEDGALFRAVAQTLDKEGHVLAVTGDTEPVTITYDGAYHVKTVADGLNHLTSYTYDSSGRTTQVDHPLASGANYDRIKLTSYDPVGNLLTRIDGRNQTTTYQYNDADGLLTNVNYASAPTQNVTVSYDAYDRANATTDGVSTASSTFDDLDLTLTATRTYTGVPAQTFTYGYYNDGSRQSMATPAGLWQYGYNANGWCTSSTSPGGSSLYEYLDNGWESKRTLPNGSKTDYAYNPLGALTSLVNKTSGGTTLSSYGTFVYDGAFNLKNVTSSIPAQTTYQGTQTWTYSQKDQLLNEAGTRLGSYSHAFNYDAAFNTTTFKGLTRTFNSDNQRTSGNSFVYDGNGNPTTWSGTTLTFDSENRMTAYGATLTAGYRGDGLRAWKQPNGGSKTYFLYDGGNPIIEMSSTGAITAINDFGADGLIGRFSSGAWTFYTFDQQGDVVQRLNAAQAVTSTSAYDAYGVETTTGSPSDPYGYNAQSGYYLDRQTGKYLCQNRYYDPAQGRFFTRDPIGFGGGINLYGYCGGGPIGAADPSGLIVPVIAVVAVVALFALIATPAVAPESSGPISYPEDHRIAVAAAILEAPCDPLGSLSDLWDISDYISSQQRAYLAAVANEEEFSHKPFEPRSTYRSRFLRKMAKDPELDEKYGPGSAELAKKGRNPTFVHPETGETLPGEFRHEPVPYRDGGTRTVFGSPWEHAANDPWRHLTKRGRL